MSDDRRVGEPVDGARLEATDVGISYGEVDVVSGVSFVVEPGEFVGLVGPNGAGKTSLLRALAGTLEPTTGTITVDGIDIHDLRSRAASRLIAVVPQDTAVSFSFDVRTVVEMGRYPHRSRFSPPTDHDRAIVDRALERTRTAQFADRAIDDVSGGERQRVVLARAIAQDTPLLLLDEPTASLDINHAIETLELVDEQVREGRAVVAAIHDLDLAARYCDRLLVVADGSLVANGPPAAVLTSETLASAFNVSASVDPNPVTGTPSVTALPGSAHRDSNDSSALDTVAGQVHVLGTGTTAATVASRLCAGGIECSVGPVSADSPVAETARRLGLQSIDTEPFAALSDSAYATLESALDEAAVTVLADLVVGSGNQRVLEIVADAPALVVVESQPFTARNYAGDAASTLYERCRERAIEATPATVLEAVQSTLEDDIRFPIESRLDDD